MQCNSRLFLQWWKTSCFMKGSMLFMLLYIRNKCLRFKGFVWSLKLERLGVPTNTLSARFKPNLNWPTTKISGKSTLWNIIAISCFVLSLELVSKPSICACYSSIENLFENTLWHRVFLYLSAFSYRYLKIV